MQTADSMREFSLMGEKGVRNKDSPFNSHCAQGKTQIEKRFLMYTRRP